MEKERTRLREEGKEEVGREEKDALRILGMVRRCIHTCTCKFQFELEEQ